MAGYVEFLGGLVDQDASLPSKPEIVGELIGGKNGKLIGKFVDVGCGRPLEGWEFFVKWVLLHKIMIEEMRNADAPQHREYLISNPDGTQSKVTIDRVGEPQPVEDPKPQVRANQPASLDESEGGGPGQSGGGARANQPGRLD